MFIPSLGFLCESATRPGVRTLRLAFCRAVLYVKGFCEETKSCRVLQIKGFCSYSVWGKNMSKWPRWKGGRACLLAVYKLKSCADYKTTNACEEGDSDAFGIN
ncbi:hypothetical protein GOP47_0001144 [Adiantum capillus-veneris]|uniref:Uncharacterized protein n=1 Tax=Adiantum capillus-veneris TaxID=13818 RepID=A0A9D4VEA3_ADICA|nr:hypothetical protein GOP47_0001144 [Adiantum capillus-veneris]